MDGLGELIEKVNKEYNCDITTVDKKTKVLTEGRKMYALLALKVTPFDDDTIARHINRSRAMMSYYRKETHPDSISKQFKSTFDKLLSQCQDIKKYYLNLDIPTRIESITNEIQKEVNKLVANNYINKKTKKKFSDFIFSKLQEIKKLEDERKDGNSS